MVYYEPCPLFEAYAYLSGTAARFSSGAYINKQILRAPVFRSEYTCYLEQLTEVEGRLKAALGDAANALNDIFGVLQFSAKSRESAMPQTLFNIMAPDMSELTDSGESFFASLGERAEQLPRLIAESVMPADCDADISNTKEIFRLINSSGASQNTKSLLIDAVFDPEKYISSLKAMLLPAAAAFEDCRSVWEGLIGIFRESFSSYDSDAMLLEDKFELRLPDITSFSIYPSVTAYPRWLISSVKKNPHNAVCFIGVLFDRFRTNANSAANQASMISHMMNVLGDQTKFNIFTRIAEKTSYGRELAADLNLTPATISEHLSALTGIGLINPRVEGRRVYYSVNYPKVEHFLTTQRALFMKNAPEKHTDGLEDDSEKSDE